MASGSPLFTLLRTTVAIIAAVAITAGTRLSAQSLPADAGRTLYEELVETYRDRHTDGAMEEAGEDIFGRFAWFNYQRAYPIGAIPAGGRVAAMRESEAIERLLERGARHNGGSASLLSAAQWESVGPTNQGGRVRAIAVHPTNPSIILVGAAAGGVWKTTDGGTTWRPTFDRESAIAIGALAFDRSDPRIVYAGTGENFPTSQSLLTNTPAYLGNGIFKSTDEGLTWQGVGLESVGAISKIIVHRQNPSIVYAATARENGGFYRSSDAGATWTRTANGDYYDLSVNPANPDELYIARASGVQRSTDAGMTFTSVSTGLNAGVRYSVAVAPSAPATLYALGAVGGGDLQRGELYKSTDRGASWRLLRSLEPSFFNGQGIYDNFIMTHAADEDIVLAGGIDIYRTSDGGDTWTNVTRVYSGGSVHPDQHLAEFAPSAPDVVVLGNDGGVYLSVDAGVTWSRKSNGLAITQFYRMEVDQTRPFRVYGGTQDNGTSGSFGTTGYTGDWRSVLGGDGFFVLADLGDPNWFYAELYFGALFRINANNPNQASRIDWGIPSTGQNADEGNWATPIAMSPADRQSLYTGRTNLWRTTDRGTNWTRIPVGVGSKLGAIGLSPSDTRDIVVGTITGQIRYSTDYGATWAGGAGVPGSVVTDIQFDPVRPERVYATFSGFGPAHVFRSDNYGAQWTDISTNLPRIPTNAIAIDPQNPEHLFVATDIGVFFSPTGGDFWVPFNEGMALAPVSDLRIHRTSRSLVAATHGRSMFRTSIDDIVVEPTLIAPVGGERISTPGDLEIRWFGFTSPVNVSIRYSADEPWQIVASGVTGTRVSVSLPMRFSTTARVRIEEIGSGRSLMSGPLTLMTPAHATALGRRSFVAEAIELRGTTLWATSRGSDTIYRLRLPLLTGTAPIVRTGFSGTIRDLAYDVTRDEFLVLVTNDDFSQPRIHRMDTTGGSLGTLSLPSALVTAVGIAMQGGSLAVSTAAPSPELWLLDPITGAELGRSAIEDAGTAERRGLVWNGRAFVQAATTVGSSSGFDAELQQIVGVAQARVVDRVPVIVGSGAELHFFGLTHDAGATGIEYYFATDTSGVFYRFRADILSGIDGTVAPRGGALTVALASIRPNPVRDVATLELRLERGADIRVAIVDAGGAVVGGIRDQRLESGEHRLTLPVGALASGVYYVVIESGGVIESGEERIVRPLTVVR